MNKHLLLRLHIISLILLGLGWTLDMLHIDITASFIIDVNLFNERRSVIGTLQSLWESGDHWPFLLIFLFGILVPIFKSILIFYLLLTRSPDQKWYNWVSAVSKWAMTDVFAISIFVAFLGANAMQHTRASFEAGFYYFAGYVLLSGIISMLLGKMIRKQTLSIV